MQHRWLILVCVAACNRSVDKQSRQICEQAASKYETCIGELLGPDAASMLRGKDGTAACARDDKTVSMYRACLPTKACPAFLDCLEQYARDSMPEISSAKPRREQCEQHVRDGLRGIAMQVAMLGENEPRTESAKRAVQECVLDESRAWQDCLQPEERIEVQQYGAQRQRECEAWTPELASCILNLPGAKDCKPDEHPLWRLPIVEGPAGPEVAWSLDVADDDDYDNDVRFAWLADRTLIVRDDSGLRAMREGEQRWSAPATGIDVDFAIAGKWIATRGTDDARGVRLFDIATGARATTLAGTYIDRVTTTRERVLAVSSESEVFELLQCARGKCTPKRLGVAEDVSTDVVGTWRDNIVLASSEALVVTDRHVKPRLRIVFDANDVSLTTDGAVVADDKGVAVLSFAGCSKLGENVYVPSTRYTGGDAELPADCPDCVLATGACIVGRHAVSWVADVEPVALPGGGVAFNDHGIIERTQHFGAGGVWEVNTGGHGGVAGDASHVYTVSLGLDGDGPVRLLALARETGKVAWQTTLPGPASSSVDIEARDGIIAVRVGAKLFVIEVPRQA